MTNPVTLPTLLLLAALPGFLNFGLGRKGPERVPTAADSLPPHWKTASRLALESWLVQSALPTLRSTPSGLRVDPSGDRRQLRVSVDPESSAYRSSVEFGEVPLGVVTRQPLAEWSQDAMRRSLQRSWAEKTRQSINSLGANTPSQRTTGLQFKLPEVLPARVQSILGPGGPALNVSGTESIRLSGQSNWSNVQTGTLGQRRSLFPTLDMQQDLDIRLEGQLSDRIKVNLLQNSANQIPLANRIAINYKGDEDDFVQALDLGNTSLALPGTQYVSYSGRNEGLFGAKIATRVGALDFTMLASRQEGRSERSSYQGSSSRTKQTLADLDYVKGQYFFLFDPNWMAAAGFNASIDDSVIRVYLDDGDYNNDVSTAAGTAVVDPDGLGFVPIAGARDSAFRGNFNRLEQGREDGYDILSNLYFLNGRAVKVLRLRRPLDPSKNQCLAVTYVQKRVDGAQNESAPERVGGRVLDPTPGSPDSARLLLKMLRAPRNLLTPSGTGSEAVYDPAGVFNATRELELKNFYQLPGFGIDLNTFQLTIRQGQNDPPLTSVPSTPPVPYIEVLGLDNFNETASPPQRGADGKVDGTAATSGARLFVDPENGILFFYEPRPFAPRIAGPDARPFEALLDGALTRREKLTGAPGTATAPNSGIYEKYTVLRQDALYYMDLDFTAGRAGGGSDIALGRTNITEGSEAVTVNGERWTRDRDYTIDYDLGRITLKRQLGATDQLNIDYAYAPLFAQAGRTLLGSAFTLQGRDRSLGGAFLYESKGAQDLRPRLGEEPSRTLITDLNTDLRFRPTFLTRLADRLPGVRTTVGSEFNVQAEVGASFPNPNTRNEVYVDDMEGVRDAVSLPMTPERWRWSSVPSRATVVSAGRALVATPFTQLSQQANAELHWYTPPSVVKEFHLRPNLTEAQGAKNSRQTLALSVPRRPTGSLTDTLWAGLTYPLDPVGLDLSRAQFIEIWVNDFRDRHGGVEDPRVRGLGVKLHVDLGVVSEDMMRAPNRPPNGQLDTEDQVPRDNQLTVAGAIDEDTGYDGLLVAGENAANKADLVTANDGDPEGDDWASPNSDFPDELDPFRWVTTNGVEKNRQLWPTPDTEDLNLNGSVDVNENYFQYTIDLGDTSSTYRYLNTDVYRDFRDDPSVLTEFRPDEGNGWRRYRIPLTDSLRLQFGNPDLTIARHVRIWLEGVQKPDWDNGLALRDHRGAPLVMLGGLEIVGSRWLLSDLTSAQRDSARTTVTLNSVNTVDNADVYVAPFDPGRTRSGNQELTRREQSIALEFTEFQPDDTLEAYKTFSLEENYTRYGKLSWYAAGFDIEGYDPVADDLSYFVRFASDERGQNYYEIKRRVPRSSTPRFINWQEVQAVLTRISGLKTNDDFPRTDPILYRAADGATGDSIVIRGRPSFTRIRRISFGLVNGAGSRRFAAGQLWFDEIRAVDVKKETGIANRLNVGGTLANLARYNVSWNERGAEFLSVGESRGSGSKSGQLAVTSSFDVHRFFEGTGIQLPVNYTFSRSVSTPVFNAGDDIVRGDASSRASETRSTNQTFSTSYSRNWSERSNPILRYTLGGISAGFSRTQTKSVNPSGLDSSVATTGTVNYGISPRRLLVMGVPSTKTKLYLLPERLYWNYTTSRQGGRTYERPADNRDSLVLRNERQGRTAYVDFGVDSRPLDMITHHLEGRRNLALENFSNSAFINFGQLVSWRQNFSTRFAAPPQYWLRPVVSWTAAYQQNNGPELSRDLKTLAINNNQSATLQLDLPFDRLVSAVRSPVPRVAPPSSVPAVTDSAADSTGSRPAPKPKRPRPTWRDALRRLGAINTETSVNKLSSYARMRGRPSPLYVFGLAENPGQTPDSTGRIVPELGNQEIINTEFRTRGSTRIDLAFGSSLMTSAQYTDRTGRTNGVTNRTRDWQFPNVQVEFGQVAQVVGLTRFLQSPQLRSAYVHGEQVDYTNARENETGRSKSNQWQPLLSVSGSLKSGTRAEFNVNLRSSERVSSLLGKAKTTDNNADVNLSLNRSYSKGQKVSILGKTSTVSSNITLGMTANYNRRTGETRNLLIPNSPPQNPVKEDRLNLNGTGSYDFSQNVRGTGTLGFSQTRNLTRNEIRRSIRVEARAQFSF